MIEKDMIKKARCVFLDLSLCHDTSRYFRVLVIAIRPHVLHADDPSYVIAHTREMNVNHLNKGRIKIIDFDNRIKFSAFIGAVCNSLLQNQGGAG